MSLSKNRIIHIGRFVLAAMTLAATGGCGPDGQSVATTSTTSTARATGQSAQAVRPTPSPNADAMGCSLVYIDTMNESPYFFGPGFCVYSNSRRFVLVMQGDGNLVLYDRYNLHALWASNTFGPGRVVTLQSDGNLVIYSTSNGRVVPVWSSNTSGHTYDRLVMQDDGNLVIYTYINGVLWVV